MTDLDDDTLDEMDDESALAHLESMLATEENHDNKLVYGGKNLLAVFKQAMTLAQELSS